MLKFLGALLLVGTVLGFSSGDFTVPVNSSNYTGSNIFVAVNIDQANSLATFYAKFNAYGYFSLLFSTSMGGGDYHNFEIGASVINIMDYYSSGGHNNPSRDATDNLNVLGYDSDGSTYVTVKYTRALSTGDTAGRDATFSHGQSTSWTYAWRAGSHTMSQHAGGQFISFSILLDNKSGSTGTTTSDPIVNMSPLELIHAIVLSVLWILVADFGILVKYLYSFKWRIFTHVFCMMLVLLGTIVLVALIIQEKQPNIELLSKPYGAHYVIGVMVLAWVILQCAVGAVQRILLIPAKANPALIITLRHCHLYSGYVLILLGKVNVIIGWAMKGSFAGLAICLVAAMASLGGLVMYIYWSSGSISQQTFMPRDTSLYNDRWVKGDRRSRQSYMEIDNLMQYPYCSQAVQEQNIFIFDDLVYRIPDWDFHPGGKKMIEEIKGREVDRFMYGSMFTEEDPEATPFIHLVQSMEVVDEPIARVPRNPMCSLGGRIFKIADRLPIDHGLQVFYFSSTRGSVEYRSVDNLRYLGQYFTVRGFGHTRLYTCVFSMRREKIQQRDGLIEMFDEPRTRLLTLLPKAKDEPHSASSIKRSSGPGTLPLLIKRYPRPENRFSNQLYIPQDEQFLIKGLKGRGMCLEQVEAGTILVIAGGTGLFPFLDLIDELFRLAVQKKIPGPRDQLRFTTQAAKKALQNKFFEILISANSFNELIMPDEMEIINESKLARISIRIRENIIPGTAFLRQRIDHKTRIGREVISQRLKGKIEGLSMVYICGPQKMYKDLAVDLASLGVSKERIFYL